MFVVSFVLGALPKDESKANIAELIEEIGTSLASIRIKCDTNKLSLHFCCVQKIWGHLTRVRTWISRKVGFEEIIVISTCVQHKQNMR